MEYAFLLPIITSFVITILLTPIIILLMKKLKFIDDPQTHKHPAMLHTKPIPRGGGVALFFGVFLGSLFFLSISKVTLALFIAAFLALIIGTLDDKYDLSRYLRFGVNFLCAIIVVSGGIGVPFITNPFGGIIHLDIFSVSFNVYGHHSVYILSDILAVFWIVWVMNMLNWSKGVDGQMPGVVAISSFVIGLLSLRFMPADQLSSIAATISFLITGASLGFLVYNFYPSKILPGYGATSMYLLLAAVSILSGAKLATAILVMGVPLVDGTFTIFRRIFSGHSPFWGDKKHLHHLLLELGFNQRGVALCYWIFSAILGAIALSLSTKGKAFAIIMLVVIVGGGILFLHKVINKKYEEDTF